MRGDDQRDGRTGLRPRDCAVVARRHCIEEAREGVSGLDTRLALSDARLAGKADAIELADAILKSVASHRWDGAGSDIMGPNALLAPWIEKKDAA